MQNELAEISESELVGCAQTYLRFGKFPVGRKSYNYKENVYEKGVSVFKAWKIPGSIARFYLDLRECDSYVWGFLDREMNEVAGKEVGKGTDGEPVLKGAKYVARNLPSAKIKGFLA